MGERRAAWAIGGAAALAAVSAAGYAAALVLAGTSGAETGSIQGSVGPDSVISISPAGPFAAGEYTIRVDDASSIHNFHLSGPGVDLATGVGASGTTTWNVALAPGEYQFYCDPHSFDMRGSFSVTAPATSSASGTTSTAATTTSTATTATSTAAGTTTGGTTTTATTATAATTSTGVTATATVAARATARLSAWRARAVGRAGRRRVEVRIRVTAPALAHLRLLRGRRAVAGTRRRVTAGPSLLALRVPSRARPGRYVLELRLVGPDGVARRYVRALRLPAR